MLGAGRPLRLGDDTRPGGVIAAGSSNGLDKAGNPEITIDAGRADGGGELAGV